MKSLLSIIVLNCLFQNSYAEISRGLFSSDCYGQCGEGEGDCDKDLDCLPGFICKDGGFLGLRKDVCTAGPEMIAQYNLINYGEDCWNQCSRQQGKCNYCGGGLCCRKGWPDMGNGCGGFIGGDGYHTCVLPYRVWQCDKYPMWLQKFYHLKGIDFCEAQWDDAYFSSQPHCNDKVLPTVAFYDRSDNQYETEPLCTINMNEAEDGNFENLCPEVDSIVKSDNEEVWIVYLVHGFAGYSTTPLWYPHHGVGLSNRYASNGRRIIVGEVYWKDGAEAIFDKFIPPALVQKILSATIGRSVPEDRAYLESVAEMLTCGPAGLGVGDVAGYSSAAANTMVVGNALGKLAESIYFSAPTDNVKTFCVGHSLGGHICGFTGKTFQLEGILAIDPAGPIFQDNSEEQRLNKYDAKFVQALHIDAGEFGIDQRVADEDIYVNSGKNQPYCPGFFAEAGCSHVAFSLWFLPKVWGNNDNICRANMKCDNEEDAMYHPEKCVAYNGEGLEVGLLSGETTEGNSGVFHLDTMDNPTEACAFTTLNIAQDAITAMDNGWNELWNIKLSDYLPIVG